MSPFLTHRPKTQAVIADGLAEAAKLKGVKEQAYRLHEVIEQVRAELKADIKKADGREQPDAEAKKAEPAKDPPKSPTEPPKPVVGTLAGTVVLDGKPLACSVTLVSLDLPLPRVFTAAVDDTGRYAFADPLPAGNYAVMVTDGGAVKIPAKYQSVMTSGVSVVVKGGENAADLGTQSN